MNCDTKFHKLWKDFDAEAFIPLSLLGILILILFYLFSFNTHIHHYSKEYEFISCDTITKKWDTGQIYNDGSHIYREKDVIVLKYRDNKHIYTEHLDKESQRLDIDSDKPTHCKRDSIYHSYVSLFGIFDNSLKCETNKNDYRIIAY